MLCQVKRGLFLSTKAGDNFGDKWQSKVHNAKDLLFSDLVDQKLSINFNSLILNDKKISLKQSLFLISYIDNKKNKIFSTTQDVDKL